MAAVPPAAAAVPAAVAAAQPSPAEMIAMFNQTCGLSNQASTELVNNQGIDGYDTIERLTPAQVDQVVSVLRKPGRGAGIRVSMLSQLNLHLLVYYVKHHIRIGRTVVHADVTQVSVLAMEHQKQLEESMKAAAADAAIPDFTKKDWPRIFQIIEERIGNERSFLDGPLAYGIRDDLRPRPEADDPSTNYASHDMEMIERHPILAGATGGDETGPFHPIFKIDMMKIYDVIHMILGHLPEWIHTEGMRQAKNGRAVYFKYKKTYLGGNNLDWQASQAINVLDKLSYYGERRNFTIDEFRRRHVEQHNILTSLVRYGFSGIDGHAKVRYALKGIKYSPLEVVKATVLSRDDLRQDFDSTMNLMCDAVRNQQGTRDDTRNVSEFGRGPGGGGGGDGGRGGKYRKKFKGRGPGKKRGGGGGNPSDYGASQEEVNKCTHIVDRFYTKEEYADMNPAERQKLWQLRKARYSKDLGQATKGGNTVKINALKVKVDKACAMISELREQNKLLKAKLGGKKVTFKEALESDDDSVFPMDMEEEPDANVGNSSLSGSKNKIRRIRESL